MARCKTIGQARSSFSSKYTRVRKSHNVPSSTTLTYEGMINENYYKLKKKETKLISNFEISNATIVNPITQKREYFLGLLSKSKYDGVGLREPIDIGIVLDISGSMSYNMNKKGESRLDIAKKSLITFIKNLPITHRLFMCGTNPPPSAHQCIILSLRLPTGLSSFYGWLSAYKQPPFPFL